MNRDSFHDLVAPYTITRTRRIHALYRSLEHVRLNNIAGDLVECGVGEGGNILGMAWYLSSYNLQTRKIWLYDTFQGMTEPEEVDRDFLGERACDVLARDPSILCSTPLDSVKQLLNKCPFDKEKFMYIIGDVSQTLEEPANIPNKIALLRLDTDWYKSTKKELEVLYPRLSKGAY